MLLLEQLEHWNSRRVPQLLKMKHQQVNFIDTLPTQLLDDSLVENVSSPSSPSSSSVGLIIGITVGAVILLLLLIIVAIFFVKRQLRNETKYENSELELAKASYAPFHRTAKNAEESTENYRRVGTSLLPKAEWVIDYESIDLEKEIGRGGIWNQFVFLPS